MTTECFTSRRTGFAKTALIWLPLWLGLGGYFLYKAAPKPAPIADAGLQPVLACSTPAAPEHSHTKNIEDVKAGERKPKGVRSRYRQRQEAPFRLGAECGAWHRLGRQAEPPD